MTPAAVPDAAALVLLVLVAAWAFALGLWMPRKPPPALDVEPAVNAARRRMALRKDARTWEKGGAR